MRVERESSDKEERKKKMRKMIVGRNKLSHQAKGPMKNKEGPLKPNPSSHKSYPRTSFDPTTLVEEYFT